MMPSRSLRRSSILFRMSKRICFSLSFSASSWCSQSTFRAAKCRALASAITGFSGRSVVCKRFSLRYDACFCCLFFVNLIYFFNICSTTNTSSSSFLLTSRFSSLPILMLTFCKSSSSFHTCETRADADLYSSNTLSHH